MVKRLILVWLLSGLMISASAQSGSLLAPRVWPLRTIAAEDTAFADLAPLAADIGNAQIVFLGEPSHGEGPALTAQLRLVNFLHRRLGFSVLAFESNFYEVAKAQQQRATQPVADGLQQSVFPIWAGTQEFRALVPLLEHSTLRLAGFDPQFSGTYHDDLADDLQEFIGPTDQTARLPFEPLAQIITALAETRRLPPGMSPADVARVTQPLAAVLRGTAAQGTGPRQQQAAFWLQSLRNVDALAQLTIRHPDSLQAAWRYADTNDRDAQMAENLLFIVRQNPRAKIICWGASAHFANRVTALQHPEMADAHPMGEVFRRQFSGPVYCLAVAAGGGSHGAFSEEAQLVPAPSAGSLEAVLNQRHQPYSFVSLRQELRGRVFPTSLLEYTPVSGTWSEVFDGVLFLQNVTPTHALGEDALPTASSAGPVAKAALPSINKTTPSAASQTWTGRVVDAQTGAAVEFASVQLGRTAYGCTTNERGYFALEAPSATGSERLVISRLGYQTQTVAVAPTIPPVQLTPINFHLGEVVVQARRLDPHDLLATAIRRIPQNYVQQDFNAHVYSRVVATNLDSVLRDVEYTALLYDQQGYRNRAPVTTQVEEVRWHRLASATTGPPPQYAGSTFNLNDNDALLSALFSAGKSRRFELTLLPSTSSAGQEVYVIAFRAKRLSHATTADYFLQSYTGKLYLNTADMALVRSEMKWVRDTLLLNQGTRRYFDPSSSTNAGPRLRVLAQQNEHLAIATYERNAQGQYFLATCVREWTEAGYDAVSQRNVRLHSVIRSVYYDISTQNCRPIVYQRRDYGNIFLRGQPNHPEFWDKFTRPPLP